MSETAAIFKEYRHRLQRFIMRRVPSKEDSEDILQDVFYQLSKIDAEENPIRSISSWLYAVARNLIIDRSRKHKEEEISCQPDTDENNSFLDAAQLIPDEDASPESDYAKALVWEELEAALSELPAEQRAVFELTELQGFSFKDISESTGITVNTLISRKHYAVLHLRRRLSNLHDELLNN
ncbi:MAG: sigma-70 family RNA polymerase sigma factor [Mediterranea sp.]|jgi:RNA polymerase sigma factor (sigma-70 family)|nr:sigma-70 family RNA polymerase sigma factor [Mediterranea sp.]